MSKATLILRENLPEGQYIAFVRGSVHRDDDGRAMLSERKRWKDGEVTDDVEPVARFSFGVLWPEEFRGEDASASAPWMNKDGKAYVKLADTPDGETLISINKKGTMTPNIIRWPEEMGMDWEKDLVANLPDTEKRITEHHVIEAIDRAVLKKAKDGWLVVIQTNERGWIDARDSASVIAIPMHMAEHVKDLKPGVDYEVPWPYGDKPTRQQLETPDEVSADNKASMRDYLRTVMLPALCEGEKPLDLETAQEKGYTKASGESGHLTAQKIATLANDEGYDCFAVDLMATVLSLVSGAPVQRQKMVDTLSGPQLEAAVSQLPIVLRMLNDSKIEKWQETPEPPPFDEDQPF